MNGLKYIRTRCNLSLNDLAEAIGVTRQALSAWENERKEIPKQRKKELADFFGIDSEYFGQISEKEKKYLLEKAMFRYVEEGKETYRYKPQKQIDSKDKKEIFFLGDSDISLDEKYTQAQEKKKNTLLKIEELIKWTDGAGSIESQIGCINRGCDIFSKVIDLLEEMRNQEPYLKMPFYYEFNNVLHAMLIAYGLSDKENVKLIDRSKGYSQEDGEWVLELSDEIKQHCDKELQYHKQYHEEVIKKIREENRNRKKEESPLE